MNRFFSLLKYDITYSLSITTLIFTFVPESCFVHGLIEVNLRPEYVVICNRLLALLVVFIIVCVCRSLYFKFRNSRTIGNSRYTVVVDYGNIFDKSDCMKVVSFDECYTTKLGNLPAEIKPKSICGQFLTQHPDCNIDSLISNIGLKAQKKHSNYQGQVCYESGRLLPYDDFLLLSFAKLDADGRGRLTREEYIRCLEVLWEEIDKYYAYKSVAIPILGAGITCFKDETLTQQQLLDIIISSYKMSPNKIKHPAKLHIVCQKHESFSINKIGESI